MDSYRQLQISQSDCEISTDCDKKITSKHSSKYKCMYDLRLNKRNINSSMLKGYHIPGGSREK